jgi:hypothetical protein
MKKICTFPRLNILAPISRKILQQRIEKSINERNVSHLSTIQHFPIDHKKTYVSPSQIFNFCKNDPFQDILKKFSWYFTKKYSNTKLLFDPTTSLILDKGNEFEINVKEIISNIFGLEKVELPKHSDDIQDSAIFTMTLKAMEEGDTKKIKESIEQEKKLRLKRETTSYLAIAASRDTKGLIRLHQTKSILEVFRLLIPLSELHIYYIQLNTQNEHEYNLYTQSLDLSQLDPIQMYTCIPSPFPSSVIVDKIICATIIIPDIKSNRFVLFISQFLPYLHENFSKMIFSNYRIFSYIFSPKSISPSISFYKFQILSIQ